MRLPRANKYEQLKRVANGAAEVVRGVRLKQDLNRVKFIQSTGSPLRFGKLQL